MTVTCELIKDLLPLYHDGVCSNASKALIEEHLPGCEKCRAELGLLQHALPIAEKETNLRDAQALGRLSQTWKKGMLKSLLQGVLLTLLALAIFAFIFFLFAGTRAIPKPL